MVVQRYYHVLQWLYIFVRKEGAIETFLVLSTTLELSVVRPFGPIRGTIKMVHVLWNEFRLLLSSQGLQLCTHLPFLIVHLKDLSRSSLSSNNFTRSRCDVFLGCFLLLTLDRIEVYVLQVPFPFLHCSAHCFRTCGSGYLTDRIR